MKNLYTKDMAKYNMIHKINSKNVLFHMLPFQRNRTFQNENMDMVAISRLYEIVIIKVKRSIKDRKCQKKGYIFVYPKLVCASDHCHSSFG